MSRINIATCRKCGAEFSPPILGATSDLCPQCRVEPLPPAQQPAPRSQRPPFSVLVVRFPVTSAIIALNVLVFVAMVAKGVSPVEPKVDQLLRWGADFGPLTLHGQPWRLLASCFVHAGLLHLLFNMWCLWSLGMFVERFLGRGPYLIAYLLAGLGGAVASVWWHPLVVGVGASGAIFGLAGVMVTLLRSGQIALPAAFLKRHSKSLLTFIGYNLFFGFINPHIDNSAHLGGLATGLLLGALLPVAEAEEGHNRRALAFGLTAVLLVGAFGYARTANAAYAALVAGEEAMEAKQWGKAEAEFKAAIQADPNLPDAYLDLGYVFVMQQKYADAIPVLQRATRLAPNVASGFGNLGIAYFHVRRSEEGEAPLKRAVLLEPANSGFWFHLALVYLDQNKVADATNAAQKSLQLDPKNADTRKLLSTLQQQPAASGEEPVSHPAKK